MPTLIMVNSYLFWWYNEYDVNIKHAIFIGLLQFTHTYKRAINKHGQMKEQRHGTIWKEEREQTYQKNRRTAKVE